MKASVCFPYQQFQTIEVEITVKMTFAELQEVKASLGRDPDQHGSTYAVMNFRNILEKCMTDFEHKIRTSEESKPIGV